MRLLIISAIFGAFIFCVNVSSKIESFDSIKKYNALPESIPVHFYISKDVVENTSNTNQFDPIWIV